MSKPKIYIASCSFGKDSIATILLALENGEPIDRCVFSEVMFDNSRNISGEIPEHIEWIRNVAKPKLEALGVAVDIVRSSEDYISQFFKVRGTKTKHPERIGKLQGFPIGGNCRMNSCGKIAPIHKYYRQFRNQGYDIVQYVGIAYDEPKRLARLHGSQVSLLAKYKYTERMAMRKCEEYDLVSPLYKSANRGGCWFCPNCKVKGFIHLRQHHPELWEELRKLSKVENTISKHFSYERTFAQIEERMNAEERQLKLFEL